MNIYLFLSGIFILTFILGKAIEKIRVPWIFAALVLGAVTAIYNPFKSLTDSASFELLANLGMYFMLFMIGLDINLKEIKKKSGFIFRATFLIILSEAFFGSLLIHFLFNYGWGISFVVALSFATVGEAILIPILDEFKITKTKLGQVIINIGVLDDVIEILILITVVIIVGGVNGGRFHVGSMIFSLILLIIVALILINFRKSKKSKEYFNFLNIKTLFLFTIFIFFLFLGIGSYAQASALGALLAGMSIRNLLPKNKLDLIETEIKAISYGLFAPIFFFWVGLSLNVSYLITAPLSVLLLVLVVGATKIIVSLIVARKEFNIRRSILLGVGLSVRFSTSIIIIKILFENNIIDINLYSVIIASSIVFQFLVPILFSNLLVKWEVKKIKTTKI